MFSDYNTNSSTNDSIIIQQTRGGGDGGGRQERDVVQVYDLNSGGTLFLMKPDVFF
jgi:hypothetical protein